MSTLTDREFCAALVLSLGHFVWQGTLIVCSISAVSLLATGQPSTLRQRIARLLGDSVETPVRLRHPWTVITTIIACVTAMALVIPCDWNSRLNFASDAASKSSPKDSTPQGKTERVVEADPKDVEALLAASRVGKKNFDTIKTVQLRFRHTAMGQFKSRLSPLRCSRLLGDYDLVKRPDDLRALVKRLVDDDGVFALADPPWSESELYAEGRKTRTATSRKNGASTDSRADQDIHITDDALSVHWDSANSQVDIEPIQDNRYGQVKLESFFQMTTAMTKDDALKLCPRRMDGTVTFTQKNENQEYSSERTVDATTGYLTKSILRHRELGIVREQHWLGFEASDTGIPFPRVVIHLNYSNGALSRAEFMLVQEARFNEPLPETTFQLGAPAGSTIFDRRPGLGFMGFIHHDLDNVTSVEQRRKSAEPLDKELTADEKAGVEELRPIYALSDGEVLKRIGPPYPISRKYVHRMLGERYLGARREIRSDLIRWNSGKFESWTAFSGGSYTLAGLISLLTKVEPTSITGNKTILDRTISGDFVFRSDASADQLVEKLAVIAADEFQTPLGLTFREVDRPVYIARGDVIPNLPQSIALNGGTHQGAQGEITGNSDDIPHFLREVSDYIHIKIFDEVKPQGGKINWSKRWYDLPTTKPEKRFAINPEVVLRQITEQTGIVFDEDTRKMRILVLEEGTP